MTELKRDAVKYIRDKAKAQYKKDDKCNICNSTESLDFHHYCSLSEMYTRWLKKNKLKSEDVVEHREAFIAEHLEQMYDKTVTLCHTHHLKLHSIYGRNPNLATSGKQERWVGKQKVKNGLV